MASRLGVPLLLGCLAALAGGWFGGPLLAPLAVDTVEELRSARVTPEPGGESVEAGAEVQHMLANLVVNPANSGGVRFLVASLALDVSERAATLMAERDAEVRDLVLTVLAAKSVDELSDVASRDRIRSEIRLELNRMLGFDGVSRVFFPQFVIQ